MATFFAPESLLPEFDSLLIKGFYPKASPIALAISHLQDKDDDTDGRRSDVLLLTPSREAFATALQEYNDAWMNSKLSTGAYMSFLARIQVFYPPSPAHWHLLLLLLTPIGSPGSEDGALDDLILRYPISLIIIHEPSAYFLDLWQGTAEALQLQPESTLSEYLRIVTSALSCAKRLSATKDHIPLVLFDTMLNDFKLPIVHRNLESPARRLFQQRRSEDSDGRQETVLRFVEKYFGWVGSVTEESPRGKEVRTPSQASSTKFSHFQFRIERRVSDEDIDVDIDASMPYVEQWTARKLEPRSFSVLHQTLVQAVEKTV